MTENQKNRVNPVALVTGSKTKGEPAVLTNVEIARSLQLATEKINPLIARAEKALAALKLNVSASVSLSDADDAEIVFRKDGKEWCLFLEDGDVDSPFFRSIRLHAASREERLRALSKLHDLEDALVSEALRQSDVANNIVNYAEEYLAELEARKA